jgi:hypothetical protein
VAKGYSQQQGIDYIETYAPTVRMDSLRTLIAIATYEDLEIHHLDIDTAFLNATLDEDIYIAQPAGFEDPEKPDYVCKLNKSLYGLKQAPRAWYEMMDKYLTSRGFKSVGFTEPCIYIHEDNRGKCMLSLFVDDILVSAKPNMLQWTKDIIKSKFKTKDLGEVRYVLNIEIIRNRHNGTTTLRQSNYAKEILAEFRMEDCKPVGSPIALGTKLQAAKDGTTEDFPFRQAVGKLMYLATSTRPDIAFAVGLASRHLHKYDKSHWLFVKRILRYLKGTTDLGITFDRNAGNLELSGYADADFGGDEVDRKSTSAYIFKLCGGPVSWSSKKQGVIATSTTEAEYLAASIAAREIVFLRSLWYQLGYDQKSSTILYEDNNACIKLSENPMYHARTKHFDIRHHWIRERVQNKEIKLIYCPTEDMVADMLTKALTPQRLTHLRLSAGMKGGEWISENGGVLE